MRDALIAILKGMGLGMVLVGCSSASYLFYNIDAKKSEYVGQDASLPFAYCVSNPCLMIPLEEYVKLKRDYEAMKIDLENCEQSDLN